MAVETKIGLLVGLAFIVCFGVILSHRGGGDRITPDVATDLLSRHGQRSSPRSVVPLRGRSVRDRDGEGIAGRGRPTATGLGPRYDADDATRARSESAGRRMTEVGRDGRRVVPGAGGVHENQRDDALEAPRNDPRQGGRSATAQGASGLPSFDTLFPDAVDRAKPLAREPRSQSHPERSAPPTSSRLSPPSTKPARSGPALPSGASPLQPALKQTMPAAPGSGLRQSVPAGRPPVLRRAPEMPRAPERYVVRSGDTLWRIADRVYGVRSRDLVDRIFAANRDRLESPDRLRVGMTLALPAAVGEGLSSDRGRSATRVARGQGPSQRSQRSRKSGAGGAAVPIQSYQVRAGDRYATIAERFLGDRSRWRELYELNKDIFPEADRIRPGVRIRLPAAAIAQAEPRRR